MRVLAIGNSFSNDAMSYLSQLAAAGGAELTAVDLYIGGCSLERHWNNAREDARVYQHEVNGVSDGRIVSIAEALAEGSWDVVTLQQASHDSGLPETYFPYITDLAAYVRRRAPGARIWVHETWAYETDSTHAQFPRYNCDQMTMFRALTDAYARAAEAIGAELLPCGRVIQALRATPAFDYAAGGPSLCRDGFHMSLSYGRYTLAAVWYACLTGRDIRENPFSPCPEAEPEKLALIRETVYRMCRA